MTNIEKQIASVHQLHGGERDRSTKYRSFIAWQIAQRQMAHGQAPSQILATDDDPAGKDFAGNDCIVIIE